MRILRIDSSAKADIAVFADDIFTLDARIFCKKININMPSDLIFKLIFLCFWGFN